MGLQIAWTFYTAVAPSEILNHLQTLCDGLHILDVFELQNEIQHFRLDMERIPNYVNALEDL